MAANVFARPQRSFGRSFLQTLPIAVWAVLMASAAYGHANRAQWIATVATALFMVTLFFQMMRTSTTYRWRRWFFVAVGLLFPVGFIHQVMVLIAPFLRDDEREHLNALAGAYAR